MYPVVPGGVKTLSALARELKATERAVAERVRYQLRGSYSHYYRRMLAPLLAALEFRCNNSAYRPVMDAIDLLARYAGTDSDQRLHAAGEKVPVDGVVPKAWLDGVVEDDGRVERIPYELCVLIALRDALRRREVRPPDTEVNAAVNAGTHAITSRITSGRSTRGSIAATRLRRSASDGGSGMAVSLETCSRPWSSTWVPVVPGRDLRCHVPQRRVQGAGLFGQQGVRVLPQLREIPGGTRAR
ncbi:MAG TPA: hypothetical protein VK284_02390 [Streptosporangiaceae bacterium]|nr:hypothetical protein [Streptosporangiaceae bacterium]